MSSSWQPKIRLPFLVSINLWVLWYPSFGHWFTRLPAGLHLYQIRKIQYVQKHGFYWTSDIWLKYLTHNWRYGGRSLSAIYRYSSWKSISLTLTPNQGKNNRNRQTKTKTLLNSAAAVKQSNNAQEFQSAHWAIIRGRFSPHSYSTPLHN